MYRVPPNSRRIRNQARGWALVLALAVSGCSGGDAGPTGGAGGASGAGGEGGAPGERFDPIRVAVPIERSSAEELGVESFVGSAVVPRPLPEKPVPGHPRLDNGGDSRIHNDHYNSGVYDRLGPLGPSIDVQSHLLGDLVGICAMMTILRNGYVVGSCFVGGDEGSIDVTLTMFDERNLDIVAERRIGPRPFIPNASGGAYFSMDEDERIYIGPPNELQRYRIDVVDGAPEFVLEASLDMTPHIREDALLQDSILDHEGRLWFMATTGEVGYANLDDETVRTLDLSDDLDSCNMADDTEVLQNSIANDQDAIYMVTCAALYRLSADGDGEVQIDWRAPYDTGTSGGLLLPGSGTSPTLFGLEDDLVTICDNADGQINLLVLDRASGTEVCKTPLFRPGESATENSSIGYGDDVVVANNAGFGGPFAPANTMKTGLERYRVRSDRSGCDLVWANDDAIINSNQLATESGVIWGYGADPTITDTDVFYLGAHDWETGEEIFRAYVGDTTAYDPITGQVHLHPNGSLLLGARRGPVLMQ